jgi:hypothetical protein
LNGGSCIDSIDSFSCTCSPYFSNTFCQDGLLPFPPSPYLLVDPFVFSFLIQMLTNVFQVMVVVAL